MEYGMTKDMIKMTKKKIRDNRFYLDNNFITVDNQDLPLSSFFKNAYINPDRYVAELQNRVHSLASYANEQGLVNVFVTLTLPSQFHKFKMITKNGKNIHIKNDKFIGDDLHTPKQGSKVLSKLFKKIIDLRAYRNLPKEKRVYFRVTEPHKSGTPHLHISFFVPPESVDQFVKSILNLYQEPQVKIETNVLNPVAYLMKYVLKTLDDFRYGEDSISELTLWYIYWGINRIYTSRTFISLDVYRCLGGRYTLQALTKAVANREIVVYTDPKTNKVLTIFDEWGGMIYNRKNAEFNKDVNYNNMRVEERPIIRQKRTKDIVPITIDHQSIQEQCYNHNLIDGEYKRSLIPINKYSDNHLYKYYNSLDIETVDLNHYGLVHNEMVDRGLLSGYIESLNDFNVDFGEVCYE